METAQVADGANEALALSPNRVVGGSADDESVAILQTRNPSLVAVQRSHEFARRSVPNLKREKPEQAGTTPDSNTNLDGAVPGSGHDVLVVKIHHVHCGPVPHQHSAHVNLFRRNHVPNSDGAVLTMTGSEATRAPQLDRTYL